jgi:ubiquinone/menaquinone biosynthesis C-methylase UbiE
MKTIVPAGGSTGAPLNLQQRLALMNSCRSLSGLSALDCGCGQGQYVLGMLADGADAYGIEYIGANVVQFAAQHPEHAHRVSQGDVEHLPYPDESFDVALLNEVLEHVPDDAAGLRQVWRVLRPGGMLFVFSPNRLYPFETHGVNLRRGGRRVPLYTPFVPYVPERSGLFTYWARNYWPGQLRDLIHAAGFDIVHTDFVWQTFENISGKQPRLLSQLKPALRQAAAVGQRLPGVRMVGAVSQFVAAIKP